MINLKNYPYLRFQFNFCLKSTFLLDFTEKEYFVMNHNLNEKNVFFCFRFWIYRFFIVWYQYFYKKDKNLNIIHYYIILFIER